MSNELTQFLAQEESSGGKNKKALVPDKNGALGKYQLQPALYSDIQRNFPEFKDIPFERAALEPGLDRRVADAGIQTISKMFATELNMPATPALIATTWQQGFGNMKQALKDSQGGQLRPQLGRLGKRRYDRATRDLHNPLGE